MQRVSLKNTVSFHFFLFHFTKTDSSKIEDIADETEAENLKFDAA